MSAAPIAMGAIGVPPSTHSPMVSTRKNVPMNSVTYLFIVCSCQLRVVGHRLPCIRSEASGPTCPCSPQRALQIRSRHRLSPGLHAAEGALDDFAIRGKRKSVTERQKD